MDTQTAEFGWVNGSCIQHSVSVLIFRFSVLHHADLAVLVLVSVPERFNQFHVPFHVLTKIETGCGAQSVSRFCF